MSRHKKTRAQWERIHITREALAGMFPAAIKGKGGGAKVPLKIGIYHDIKALTKDTLDQRLARATVAVYCTSPNYLKALVEGVARVDLQGNPAGDVTAEQAAAAVEQLRERNASKLARVAA